MRTLTRCLALLCLLPALALAGVKLEGNTDSLEIVTSTAASIDYSVTWSNVTATALTTPGTSSGNIASATTTTAVAAPSASNWRELRNLNITVNSAATTSNNVIVQIDRSTNNRQLWHGTLQTGDHLIMDGEGVFRVFDTSGSLKTAIPILTGNSGSTKSFMKVGATSEAAGLWQVQAKDTGFPGAWVPGTPGVNGDALSCEVQADATIAGAQILPNAVGGWYLTNVNVGSSVAGMPALFDVIWYNTAIVVTTLTAQTFTVPTLPSRDDTGTNNGVGWRAAILVTTATTNAGAITNTTLSYTDQDGNAGATATISSFPITGVAGLFVPFQLAAGDSGIRTIASVTLGTSYGGGAISIVMYRPIAYVPSPLANIGGNLMSLANQPTGVRVWNGTCFWHAYLASTTTATTQNGNYMLVDR